MTETELRISIGALFILVSVMAVAIGCLERRISRLEDRRDGEP
jgi:hypothetical protein